MSIFTEADVKVSRFLHFAKYLKTGNCGLYIITTYFRALRRFAKNNCPKHIFRNAFPYVIRFTQYENGEFKL